MSSPVASPSLENTKHTHLASPFLKWAGGKRWLVPTILSLVPKTTKRYIEPFLGSGAIFFALSPDSAILSDTNTWLIDTYSAIRDEPEKVLKHLRAHQRKHSSAYYYKVRDSKVRSSAQRAAKLIYLNRTCWNALFRVNTRGEFNVPKGTKSSVVHDNDDFLYWSEELRKCELFARDFEETLNECGCADFVFADPPYVTTHSKNGFIKYNENLFTWQDQERLARAAKAAADRGATVVVSNSDHKSIRDLYAPLGAKFRPLTRSSIIAADGRHRRPVNELLITLGLGPVDVR